MYQIEIRQRPDGRWLWEVTTQDYENHPLYNGHSDFRFRTDRVSAAAKTAEKAMDAASKFAAEYVARDLMRQLRQSFTDAAPRAIAKT